MFNGKKIVLGVTGSIAIYKIPELIRNLRNSGIDVQCIMSRGALEFMSPLIFQTLTGRKVPTTPFSMESNGIDHIEVSRGASLFLIAPATADIIGKIASGTADDILTSSLLAFDGTLLLAPAMNKRMWKNKIVQDNIKKLKSMGFIIIPPSSGYLACGEEGEGRLADIDDIALEVRKALLKGPLSGKKVLITGGATREFLDPVRFLTNSSTGIMGVEISKACYALGAEEVLLITGVNHPKIPSAIKYKEVTSAEDMLKSVKESLPAFDLFIMSAAVADYKPSKTENSKIKKRRGDFSLQLTGTPDILTEVKNLKKGKTFVGFSAETNNLIKNSIEKIKKKNLDYIIANQVPESFGSGPVSGYLIDKKGKYEKISSSDKFSFSISFLGKILSG